MKICRNIIIPLLLLSLILFFTNSAQADENGYSNFDDAGYSGISYSALLKDADNDFLTFLKSPDAIKKEQYLNSAMNKYYILTKIDNSKIPPCVQLGRIHDEKNNYDLAVEYFHKALNINASHPYANFYLGEFYFKRKEYIKAVKYYNRAYINGLNRHYDLNYKLAVIHEKFADLANAKKYYEISYSIKPEQFLKEKILLINELNYDKSEYYHNIVE